MFDAWLTYLPQFGKHYLSVHNKSNGFLSRVEVSKTKYQELLRCGIPLGPK